MNVMVVGVLVLASALVRERGEMVRDWQSRVTERNAATLPRVVEDGAVGEVGVAPTEVVESETLETVLSSEIPGEPSASGDASSSSSSPLGQWEIACEIKSGNALTFDRASLREIGPVTLVRWSAPQTRMAGPGDQIFTAVVNCREKSIEAAWPGRSRETRAGTCGRGLVEAVCAASGQAAAGRGHRLLEPGPGRRGRDGTPPPR
jgi:hypothetical protein